MSSVFELDEAGWDQRVADARLEPQPKADTGFFDNAISATGQGIMRGGAKAADFLTTFFGGQPAMSDEQERIQGIADTMQNEQMQSAVDFWTPDARTVGVAGRVLGGLGEIVLPVIAGAGSPTLLVGSQTLASGKQLVNQGVDAGTAGGVAAVEGAATAAGFAIPVIGKTLGQRVMSSAVGNVGVSMGATFAQRMTLEKRGYDELAEQYDPLDIEGRTVDLLIGAAFGFVPQGGANPHMAPSNRAAILTGANARHFQVDTAPGRPLDADASANHQKAMETALAQLLNDEPVSVQPEVLESNFEPRPAQEPVDLKMVSEIIGELPEDRFRQRREPSARGSGIELMHSQLEQEAAIINEVMGKDPNLTRAEAIKVARGRMRAEAATAAGEPVDPFDIAVQSNPRMLPQDIYRLQRQPASRGNGHANMFSQLEEEARIVNELMAQDPAMTRSAALRIAGDRMRASNQFQMSELEIEAKIISEAMAKDPSMTRAAAIKVARERMADNGKSDLADYLKNVVDKRPVPDIGFLSRDPRAYMEPSETSAEIPLDRVRLTKSDTAESGDNAIKRFAAAASGEIPKRAPVSVEIDENGKMHVVDGNGTVTALKKMGLTSVFADVRPSAAYLKAVEDAPAPMRAELKQRFAGAAKVLPVFEAGMREIAKEVNGEFLPAPLKGVRRTIEKALSDYAGDVGKVKDIVRGTIVIDDFTQAQATIDAARARFGEPTKLRNLLDQTVETIDGYRDVNLNFKIDGQTVELLLNLPEMVEAKDVAHDLYKKRRSIQAKSEFTADDDAAIIELDKQMKAIYAAAWNEALRRSNSSADISLPSSRAKLSETGRPDGTSKAMTLNPPDSSDTVATGTPSTSQKTDSLPSGHIDDSSNGIIAENGQQSSGISQEKPTANQAFGVQTVSTAAGRKLRVKPKLIELADAVASDSPDFPKELQPRQRGQRKALDQQVRDIAQNLDPERLGQSAEADRGAPITGKGNIVESGNGRVMALRYVYENLPEKAAEYRKFLESQGYDTKGMKQPVLVRERITELDDSQRQAFTVEANQAATAALSPVERAQADARLLDAGTLSAMRGGDLTTTQNAGFVRAFLERLTGSERNAMLNPDGSISQEGVRRIQAALLAKAYGGKPESNITLGRMLESTDSDMRAALGALLDAAPAFARLRQSIADGKISGEYDISGALTEAIENTAKLRLTGQSLRDFLAQGDMLTNRAPIVDNLMKALYDKSGTRIAGREKIAATLTKYAGQAARQRLDQASLFAEPPVSVDDLVNTTTAEPEQTAPKVADMFGLKTPQGSMVTDAAKAALEVNDIEVPTGAVDADGNTIVRSGREIMAEAEADIQKAEDDAVGFEAAVSCIMTRGLDDAA